jgi:hypothetical protein
LRSADRKELEDAQCISAPVYLESANDDEQQNTTLTAYPSSSLVSSISIEATTKEGQDQQWQRESEATATLAEEERAGSCGLAGTRGMTVAPWIRMKVYFS